MPGFFNRAAYSLIHSLPLDKALGIKVAKQFQERVRVTLKHCNGYLDCENEKRSTKEQFLNRVRDQKELTERQLHLIPPENFILEPLEMFFRNFFSFIEDLAQLENLEYIDDIPDEFVLGKLREGLASVDDKSALDTIRNIDVEYKEPPPAKEVVATRLTPEIAALAV